MNMQSLLKVTRIEAPIEEFETDLQDDLESVSDWTGSGWVDTENIEVDGLTEVYRPLSSLDDERILQICEQTSGRSVEEWLHVFRHDLLVNTLAMAIRPNRISIIDTQNYVRARQYMIQENPSWLENLTNRNKLQEFPIPEKWDIEIGRTEDISTIWIEVHRTYYEFHCYRSREYLGVFLTPRCKVNDEWSAGMHRAAWKKGVLDIDGRAFTMGLRNQETITWWKREPVLYNAPLRRLDERVQEMPYAYVHIDVEGGTYLQGDDYYVYAPVSFIGIVMNGEMTHARYFYDDTNESKSPSPIHTGRLGGVSIFQSTVSALADCLPIYAKGISFELQVLSSTEGVNKKSQYSTKVKISQNGINHSAQVLVNGGWIRVYNINCKPYDVLKKYYTPVIESRPILVPGVVLRGHDPYLELAVFTEHLHRNSKKVRLYLKWAWIKTLHGRDFRTMTGNIVPNPHMLMQESVHHGSSAEQPKLDTIRWENDAIEVIQVLRSKWVKGLDPFKIYSQLTNFPISTIHHIVRVITQMHGIYSIAYTVKV